MEEEGRYLWRHPTQGFGHFRGCLACRRAWAFVVDAQQGSDLTEEIRDATVLPCRDLHQAVILPLLAQTQFLHQDALTHPSHAEYGQQPVLVQLAGAVPQGSIQAVVAATEGGSIGGAWGRLGRLGDDGRGGQVGQGRQSPDPMFRSPVDILLNPPTALGVVAPQMHHGLARGQLNHVVAKFLLAFARGRPGGDNDVLGCLDLAYPLVVSVAMEQEIKILLQPPTKLLGF